MPSAADAGNIRPGDGSLDSVIDTSVAVPALLVDHEAHAVAAELVRSQRCGLVAHALLETYSVVTRLPEPLRIAPSTAAALLARAFPERRGLPPERYDALLHELAGAGLGGGAIYDALIGATARFVGLPLITRDRRAAGTYAAVGAQTRLLVSPGPPKGAE